jgi:hypothetical protein
MTQDKPIGGSVLLREAVLCAVRVIRLLLDRRLHVRGARVGARVALPDGRAYVVFRETTCDTPSRGTPVMLAVWFHLRLIPAGARIRSWLFERVCVLNTALFAGFEGYLAKLWMVDSTRCDYAGLYSWTSASGAQRYGRYITAILRPLSSPGTVGYQVAPEWTLEEYLSRGAGG